MQPTRLQDFIYYQLDNFPQQQMMGYFYDGKWQYYSTTEILEQSLMVAGGLLQSGLVPGDKVATVIYKNRPEWVIADLAMLHIGVINVPVYPTISAKEYEYIFNDAGVKMCFCGDGDLVDKVTKAQQNVPSLNKIITFDKREGFMYWKDLFNASQVDLVKKISEKVSPSDLATLIYTSGTTGNPKGVMLSHNNIVSNIKAVEPLFPIGAGAKVLSFLPLCHVFERVVTYAYMYLGANITFTGTDNLGGDNGDLKTIKPHFFTTVPRLLEKVYEKIYNKGLDLKGIKKALFFWALKLTDTYEYDMQYSGLTALKMKIADKLIFSKWREALGGNIKGILTGAAQCPVKIARVFSAAGVPIREGYGMTETSPGISISQYTQGGSKLGYVGPIIEGVEVLIDTSEGDYKVGEGEILVIGSNVMMGYYNKPEQTAEMFKEVNERKWLKTGDIGRLDLVNGKEFLKITDRKKELFKTSGGKYIAPSPIESLLKEEFLIENAMVVGSEQKFAAALLIPSQEGLQEWMNIHGLPFTTLEDACKNPRVLEKFKQLVDRVNSQLGQTESIKKFTVLPTAWEPIKADGSASELTPTLKLKRRVILEKFQNEIQAMYE